MSLLPAIAMTAAAQEGASYTEVRGAALFGVEGTPYTFDEVFRPSFERRLSEHFAVGATVEAAFHQGRDQQAELENILGDSDFASVLDLLKCGWQKHPTGLFGVDDVKDALSVPRLYVDHYGRHLDLRVGRQAIQWGSAIVVHPADPFPQVTALSPWANRDPVNAARLTVPFGPRAEVQGVAALDDTLKSLTGAGRATWHAGSLDLSLDGAWRQQAKNGLVGLDLKGTAGIGYWAEGALHFGIEQEPYVDLAVGADYSFGVLSGLILQAQYYHHGAGEAQPRSYDLTGYAGELSGPTCETEEATDSLAIGDEQDAYQPLFVGRHYLDLQGQLELTEALAVRFATIWNLGDGSGVAIPWLSLRPTGRLELSTSAQLPFRVWGDEGEFYPSPGMLSYVEPSPVGGLLSADLDPLVAAVTWTTWVRVHF
jgi:hypothetical protein